MLQARLRSRKMSECIAHEESDASLGLATNSGPNSGVNIRELPEAQDRLPSVYRYQKQCVPRNRLGTGYVPSVNNSLEDDVLVLVVGHATRDCTSLFADHGRSRNGGSARDHDGSALVRHLEPLGHSLLNPCLVLVGVLIRLLIAALDRGELPLERLLR